MSFILKQLVRLARLYAKTTTTTLDDQVVEFIAGLLDDPALMAAHMAKSQEIKAQLRATISN